MVASSNRICTLSRRFCISGHWAFCRRLSLLFGQCLIERFIEIYRKASRSPGQMLILLRLLTQRSLASGSPRIADWIIFVRASIRPGCLTTVALRPPPVRRTRFCGGALAKPRSSDCVYERVHCRVEYGAVCTKCAFYSMI